MVGSPETVARNITTVAKSLCVSRFDLKYSHGTLPHEAMMESIELYAADVAPRVRGNLGRAWPAERCGVPNVTGVPGGALVHRILTCH